MGDTVVSEVPADKVEVPWTRATVLREAQRLYHDSMESSIKLKCLEMILELLGPDAPAEPETPDTSALDRARARISKVE